MKAELVTAENIDILRVFYYRYPWHSWMAKATRDYQRCFGVNQVQANHLSVQLGSKVYEVSLEGTTCYDYDDRLLMNPELIAFYECDISDLPNDAKAAARFTLDYDVLCDRKLATTDCMRYLRQWLFRGNKRTAFDYKLDFSLEPGTIDQRKFSLPYTCATQAAFVFNRLFGVEPIADSHLPTTIMWMTLALSDSSVGNFLTTIDT